MNKNIHLEVRRPIPQNSHWPYRTGYRCR